MRTIALDSREWIKTHFNILIKDLPEGWKTESKTIQVQSCVLTRGPGISTEKRGAVLDDACRLHSLVEKTLNLAGSAAFSGKASV